MATIEETLELYQTKLNDGTLTDDERRRLLMFHLLSQPDLPDMQEQEMHEYLILGWIVSTILKKSPTTE